jgi:hypothetical protein
MCTGVLNLRNHAKLTHPEHFKAMCALEIEEARKLVETCDLTGDARFWKGGRTADQKGYDTPVNTQAVRFLFPSGKDD